MAETRPFADCWFLSGPTAGGKTSVGLELAGRLGAEIISLDSMALYHRLDIGTAKPTAGQRRAIPHHLIDLVEPSEEFSLARYVAAAGTAAAEIRARGRRVLFVGGTPLYLKALLRGIFEGPAADWELRRALESSIQTHGRGWIYQRVEAVDPVAARRLHPNDTRRLIRAYEVHQLTGQPISRLQQQFDRAQPPDECHVYVLDRPRDELYARINDRVVAMFAAGLVAEVEQLLAEGCRFSRTARHALGYREVVEYLAQRRDLSDTRNLVQIRTRNFAKRQMTWFRSLSECRWIAVSRQADPAEVARRITP
ncbi:MAG TPA: tRNA (adenosine(37)-N6)-dimethylallyltransferase MiaA [Pirellulales bacterium]|nr:tRNA (adenosine(37)-N6)-dimethylallyltransferase MiaA [Pirellulales bacterium]